MRTRAIVLLAALLVLVGGCATFPEERARDWRPQAEGEGELGGPPNLAPPAPPPPRDPSGPPPPERPRQDDPCAASDERVVASCLGPIGAIAVLPDGESALVGETDSGRILVVRRGTAPAEVTRIPVDGSGGGGLLGMVLSPAYQEDRLAYALIRTPGDQRVIRIAPNEPPEPVFTGIPRNGDGALGLARDGNLLIATGRSPAGPAGPLSGKVIRVDTLGLPARGNPEPGSPVYSDGVSAPGGICVDRDSGDSWVTDRQPTRDVVTPITPGRLGTPTWTWPDRPHVAGCAVASGFLAVAQPDLSSILVLQRGEGGQVTDTPQDVLAGEFGHVRPAAVAGDGMLWTATTNRRDGTATARDDVVLRLPLLPGGNGSDRQ